MRNIRLSTIKYLGSICLSLAVLPAGVHAQNRPQGGGMGVGAMGGQGGVLQQMQQVFKQLDLTADQQSSIADILQQARQDARDAGQGIQGATPQERQQKMQDMQKIVNDATDKAEGLLTPEQKAKYYPLSSKALVSTLTDRVKMLQTASAKVEIADDERAQLKKLFDADLKSLDGYKTDAAAVTDAKGSTDLKQKTTALMQETRKQLVDILGPDDLQQLMQNMRSGARNNASPAGADAPADKPAPTTKPAEK